MGKDFYYDEKQIKNNIVNNNFYCTINIIYYGNESKIKRKNENFVYFSIEY